MNVKEALDILNAIPNPEELKLVHSLYKNQPILDSPGVELVLIDEGNKVVRLEGE